MEPAVHTKEWSAPVRTTVTGEPPKPDVPTETSRSELRRHDLRFITPLYKTEATTNGKPESELITEAKVQTRPLDRPADYRVEKEEETYRLHMIDPKTEPVRTEVTSRTLPADLRRIRKPLDFPSSHSHCSFIKLNPLERPQRQRLRSVEVRPITPHDYLSESLERHRAISLSPLRSKLKVDEKSVNEPWQRISRLERKDVPPSWRTLEKEIPQRAAARQQEMAEMAEIRKKLLENARNRSTVNVNEVSKVEAELLPIPSPTKCQSQTNVASWEYNNAFSPRSVVSINGHTDNRGLLRIRTDLSPAASKFQSVPKSNVSVQTYGQTAPVAPQVVPLQAVLLPIGAASSFTSEWTRDYRTVHEVDGKFPSGDAGDTGSRQSTLIKIKDEHAKKPKSIMKQQKLATEESRSENVRRTAAREETPQVTETIEKIEETTTTEEVERRIRGRSKRDKRERHHGRKGEHRHLGYARGRAGALGWAQQRSATFDDPPWTTPFGASQDSPWRHRPMVQGNYEHHQTSQPTVRETYHREVKSKKVHDSGSNGAYYRTPEYRRRDDYWRDDYGRGSDFHKSYSSRNIFHNEFADDFDTQYPIVEFPPTLPRDSDAHQQRHHHVQKSRSLLDWEDQRRADMMRSRRAWDDGMDDLERDFRDSLLMPMPPYGGNLKQREYREQEIPGGHETFSREVTAQSGTRPYSASGRGGSSGGVTHFKESKQEMQYKKEHTTDRL